MDKNETDRERQCDIESGVYIREYATVENERVVFTLQGRIKQATGRVKKRETYEMEYGKRERKKERVGYRANAASAHYRSEVYHYKSGVRTVHTARHCIVFTPLCIK